MGVLTPLSEQLAKPFPHAIVLITLDELSSDSIKLLPEGSILYLIVICFIFELLIFFVYFETLYLTYCFARF
jgi:ABC-type uncharacterized transport system permease subunit